MRLSIVVVAALFCAAGGSAADAAMKLAQTSNVTNCMLLCGSQVSTCRSACIIPGTPVTGATNATTMANAATNATSSTACLSYCATQQLQCQTTCARQSPSP